MINSSYYLSGSLSVGIWRKVGGVWSLFTTEGVNIFTQTGAGGVQTVGWSLSGTYALGAGVTDFGVTIESQDGTAAALTNLDVSYSAQTSSGTRSATPGGESVKATVRP